MGRSGVRGEGARPRVERAADHGWDDTVYEGGPGEGGGARQGDGTWPGDRGDGRTATDDPERIPGSTGVPDEAAHGVSTPEGKPGGGGGRRQRSENRGGGGPRRPRRRKRRALRWTAMVVSVLILGTAAAGYLYYRHLNGNIKKDDLNLGEHKAPEPTPNAAGQTPLNILLIGSDSRNSAENLKLGGHKESVGAPPLADVQMLLHLSADRSNMSVISMPRDTLVDIPKCVDKKDGKVYPASTIATMTNATLGRGGAGCTVATWEKLTNIHINHFMMVDFAGVVDMADAIGGVPVCVDANVYSHTTDGKGSGLKLKEGTTPIKGEQALQWLRTRYGFGDGSDIGRATAQHQYMNSMVRELRKNATISNPGKLRALAETATKALTVDNGLDTVMKLYDLGNELKKVPPDRITMTTMPFNYLGARVVPKPGDAEQLFRLVREDIALDGKDKPKKSTPEKLSDDPAAPDAQIAVQVVNGTRTNTLAPVGGRATAVTQVLTGKGFTRATADATQALAEPKTVINYPSVDLEGDAQRVAKSLGIPLSSVKKSTDVSGVTLTVGADWREGNAYPKKAADPKDDKTPKSADALNGADDSACMKVNPNFTW
ncbi:LCP family protein [Streptomyces sp. NPDC058001]|uniref:LCP family protein n=1 Tax=Streptomyces sp. NPDC058001 TaxID=3346300 RepID=UPI0036EA7DA5